MRIGVRVGTAAGTHGETASTGGPDTEAGGPGGVGRPLPVASVLAAQGEETRATSAIFVLLRSDSSLPDLHVFDGPEWCVEEHAEHCHERSPRPADVRREPVASTEVMRHSIG